MIKENVRIATLWIEKHYKPHLSFNVYKHIDMNQTEFQAVSVLFSRVHYVLNTVLKATKC